MRLSEIYFKNYLLLGNGKIVFKEGFNAITGETGAGKSMLLGIISLLKGEKIIWEKFKPYKDDVEISGIFIKDGEELIVKRVIMPSKKKSRFLLNDSPVTRETILKEIGDYIEISSQHEHSSLLRENTHIEYYDMLAGIMAERKEFEKLYNQYIELKNEIKNKQRILQELAEKREYLKFKLKELENLNTYPGEEEELEELIYRLENLESLRQAFEEGILMFYDAPDSIYEKTSLFLRRHSQIMEKDPEGKNILPLIENILIFSEEIFNKFKELLSSLSLDPEELENKRSRLFRLKEVMSRYGLFSSSEVIKEINTLKTKISSLVAEEDEIDDMKDKLEKLFKHLLEKAEQLSKKRHLSRKDIESSILKELKKLGFVRIKFKVNITPTQLTEKGSDLIDFHISTTGANLLPLKSVASGGELSRILLAFKSLLSQNQPEKILIFDEIDAGIGGKTARVVGNRLKHISKYSQVIAITHLPQIASLADAHFHVARTDDKITTISIKELSEKERMLEIARMLSGDSITESAIKHARTLMEGELNG